MVKYTAFVFALLILQGTCKPASKDTSGNIRKSKYCESGIQLTFFCYFFGCFIYKMHLIKYVIDIFLVFHLVLTFCYTSGLIFYFYVPFFDLLLNDS